MGTGWKKNQTDHGEKLSNKGNKNWKKVIIITERGHMRTFNK